MAAYKSSYLKSALIKHVMGVTTWTKPTNVYLSLHTGDPTVGGGNEVSGGSGPYARKALGAILAAESGGQIATNTDINFTGMPGVTVTHWGLYDASTGGNLLYYGQLDLAEVITAGNTFTVKAGNATFAEA